MNPAATLRKHGIRGTAELYWSELCYRYARFRTRSVTSYQNPTPDEMTCIESELAVMGVPGGELIVDSSSYQVFMHKFPFPSDYHGGMRSGHWHEKIFEHYLSFTLLGIDSYGPKDTYLDVAAGGSPWVRMLRELCGLDAYAIDLVIRPPVRGLSYYREEDATNTSFAPSSVRVSLFIAPMKCSAVTATYEQ